MSAEEFEKIFGNIPFEDIKKIQEYIDINYITKQKIQEKIEELEEKIQENTDEQGYWGNGDYEIQKEILEGLLEE